MVVPNGSFVEFMLVMFCFFGGIGEIFLGIFTVTWFIDNNTLYVRFSDDRRIRYKFKESLLLLIIANVSLVYLIYHAVRIINTN
jgi:hypothetical protein